MPDPLELVRHIIMYMITCLATGEYPRRRTWRFRVKLLRAKLLS